MSASVAMDPRVWVLGAGLQGCAIALELAHRGQEVVLLDQDAVPMNRASLRNEGKIHLGLIYAADFSGDTARRQLQGALTFLPLLRRWLGHEAADALPLSTPFLYLVDRHSVLSPAELDRHYRRLNRLCQVWLDEHPEVDYLGARPRELAWATPPARWPAVNAEQLIAAFETSERAVDTDALAHAVRTAVLSHPRITFLARHRVHSLQRTSGGVDVRGAFEAPDDPAAQTVGFERTVAQVVNATWENRLRFDVQMGLPPSPGWLHRLKYRVIVRLPDNQADQPSATMVLGRYGDVVIRPNATAFVSWYPDGLRGWSEDLTPPADWEAACQGLTPPDEAQAIASTILRSVQRWYPALRDAQVLTVDAGAIFAYGRQDVDHRDSALHLRTHNGPMGDHRYVSVDTGKLTTAPWYAVMAADRLLGTDSHMARLWVDPDPLWT